VAEQSGFGSHVVEVVTAVGASAGGGFADSESSVAVDVVAAR